MYLIKNVMLFKETIEDKITVVRWQHLRKPSPLLHLPATVYCIQLLFCSANKIYADRQHLRFLLTTLGSSVLN